MRVYANLDGSTGRLALKFNEMKTNFPHIYVARKLKVRWDERGNGDYDKSAHNRVDNLLPNRWSDHITEIRRADADWSIGDIVQWTKRGDLREGWYGTSDMRFIGVVISHLEIPDYDDVEVGDPDPWPELTEENFVSLEDYQSYLDSKH